MEANFNRFMRHTKRKLIVISFSVLAPIIIIVLLNVLLENQNNIYTQIIWLRYLAFAVVECWLVYKIINYIRVLKNPSYAESKYVALHDERRVFVKMKANALAQKICLYIFALGSITFGFINNFVFCALCSVWGIIVITNLITSFYYNKKY